MTRMTYKTLIELSLKISDLALLYIETTEGAKFPEIVITPFIDATQLVYVDINNGITRLLGVVSRHNLFEDTRELCQDWNTSVKESLKENTSLYGL